MKKFYFLVTFIFYSQIIAQNWMPLQIGNHWQFKKAQINGSTWTYSLNNVVITKDTLINNNRYYWYSYWIRYSASDKKMYIWWNWDNQEKIYMDFNKVDGDTFMHVNTFSYVEEGTATLFSQSIQYKGYKYLTSSPSQNTSKTEKFVEGIGWYTSTRSVGSPYYGYIKTYNDLLMAVLKDTSGNPIYFTNHFKPLINLTPIVYINSPLFILNFSIDHQYNVENKFCFIDSVFLESYYSNGDSVIQNPIIFRLGSINNNYSFNRSLDTTLMKNGFTFNYRIIAKDKGIIPETSHSPDTGYYKCVWDFSTDIKNEENQVEEFSLSQNYPNPFNPVTSIQYAVSSRELVTLKVYDVLGREVATLVNEEKQPGVYEVEFQSSDGSRQLASGIYYYQLKAGDFREVKKMILMK